MYLREHNSHTDEVAKSRGFRVLPHVTLVDRLRKLTGEPSGD